MKTLATNDITTKYNEDTVYYGISVSHPVTTYALLL